MSADATFNAAPVTAGFSPLRRGIGRAIYWRHRLLSRRRLEATVLERAAGQPIIVLPGVLNPVLMRTGASFASMLQSEPLIQDADVLDLGTGSGVCALIAARRARRVVAVDLSPTAVRCARINALLNGLEHKIDVSQGDLFAPVAGRSFDLILFNPPFLSGTPVGEADLAWRSTDLPDRFAAGLRDHLKPAGAALLLLSTYGDAGAFLRPLTRQGFAPAIHAQHAFVNERLSLFRICDRSQRTDAA